MNFLILGNGAEERSWADHLVAHGDHRLCAAFPGGDQWPDVARPRDLDDALARSDVEAVIVGGNPEFRSEALRRSAALGLPVVCLHPPGEDSEPYYQVALSREESGAIIVPDLPLRRHPGVALLRNALAGQAIGTFRGLLHESPADPVGSDLVRHVFPRLVDVVRALLGEIEALTATGDPPGDRPVENLIVHLRAPEGRRAEVRTWSGGRETARLVVLGSAGTQALEYDPEFAGSSRLIGRLTSGQEEVVELGPWDPHAATLDALAEALSGRQTHPDLCDGTRAMELSEAAVRSLRRERTVELHYGEVSEASNFKSVMTSIGCLLLLAILVALPAALVGPAFGLGWTIYIAYTIPPLLILFVLAQALRFMMAKPGEASGEGG